jgi:putative molybdopterin biosynthesis protein
LAKRYLETITCEEAIKRVLDLVRPMDDEEYLPVPDCKDRVTARPVIARFSNPPFLCSAMDGYATNFDKALDADLTRPVRLEKHVEAFPLNTGDHLPGGTNAVIMREDVEESDTHITIRKPVSLWQHVRMIGEDVIEGDMLLPSSHKVKAFDVGMLLSAGVTSISVKRRPTCCIIPTGKELIDPYEIPEMTARLSGLIDFNSYLLAAMAKDLGFLPVKLSIVTEREELLRTLDAAVHAHDVIVINAGSSAGSEDFTEEVIADRGSVVFHGVSMMPGKPTVFGTVNGRPVFGIPGYPVAAATSFRVFLEPLFEKFSSTKIYKKHVSCTTPYKIPSRIGMREVLRVSLVWKGGRYFAIPLARGASIFSSMARADALMAVPEEVEGLEEDAVVSCELLKEEDEFKNRISIVGSHDLSLDVLRNMLKQKYPETDLLSIHVGSLSGILAVKKGVSDLCTTHILDQEQREYNIPIIKRYLPHEPWMLVHLARREQGLLVRKDNPKCIRGVSDLTRGDVTFVNRQFGSGTRILFDAMLKKEGIDSRLINGYDKEETSHTAVGVLVKESVADCGLAIYSVAKQFSLGFLPVAEEDYDLLVTREFSEDQRFDILMELIRSDQFKEELGRIGGYNTEDTGTVKYVNGQF